MIEPTEQEIDAAAADIGMAGQFRPDQVRSLRRQGANTLCGCIWALACALAKLRVAVELIEAQREWIDAVPADAELPAMPGHDRDWFDGRLAQIREGKA